MDRAEFSEDKRFVVYLGGGAMSGVYSAGVLRGLHNLSLDSGIEAIYSGSVGSLNAAYLLSGQIELGPTIYWEDLERNFIFPENVFYGTLDLIVNRFIRKLEPHKVRSVVDIDYAMRIVSGVKPLNMDNIQKNPTELFVKVLSLRTGRLVYLRFRDFPSFNLFRAAICIKPHFFGLAMVGDEYYIDGTIKESLGIGYLLDRYPNRKIVVVLNEPIERGIRHYIKNWVEGTVGSLYPYDISLFDLFIQREKQLRSDIKLCLRNENVLLLYPNFSSRARPRTTSPTILKATFSGGINDSEKVDWFINGRGR